MADQDREPAPEKKTGRIVLNRKIDNTNPETFAMKQNLLVPDIRQDFGSGMEIGATLQFKAVPAKELRTLDEPWRVLLMPTDVEKPTIALDVWGDADFGRGDKADVDLTDYEGIDRGVSRRHALLRATRNALFVIDLGSSNGTHLNGVPLGSGMALRLNHDDSVSFGNLHFTINILNRPESPPTE